MAARKRKSQGNKNNIKIKSKINKQKGGLKQKKAGEKPLDNLKWFGNMAADNVVNHCETVPNWLTSRNFKRGRNSRSSIDNSCGCMDYPPEDAEEKSSTSGSSDECNCSYTNYSEKGKCGILKKKKSSTNSLVAKYIKSGMDQVASFIVESAIRFGEQHGVVVPDKNLPNVYELTPPEGRFDEKCRKIRFKIPDQTLGYEDAKKVMWRSRCKSSGNDRSRSQTNDEIPRQKSKNSLCENTTDSLEDILPLLEKLKESGGIVTSELDLDKLTGGMEPVERRKKKDGDRARDRFRMRGKRYKSVGAMSDKSSEVMAYAPSGKSHRKRFKLDSVELGRQRLRAANCNRKSPF